MYSSSSLILRSKNKHRKKLKIYLHNLKGRDYFPQGLSWMKTDWNTGYTFHGHNRTTPFTQLPNNNDDNDDDDNDDDDNDDDDDDDDDDDYHDDDGEDDNDDGLTQRSTRLDVLFLLVWNRKITLFPVLWKKKCYKSIWEKNRRTNVRPKYGSADKRLKAYKYVYIFASIRPFLCESLLSRHKEGIVICNLHKCLLCRYHIEGWKKHCNVFAIKNIHMLYLG